MALKSMEGYKTAVLAELGDEEAKQNLLSETPGFNMMGGNSTTTNQTYEDIDKISKNKEVEIGLGINSLSPMTDEEKQTYIDGLSDAQYRQMKIYKNQGYSFEASKALLENSDRLVNPIAQGYDKYNKKGTFVQNTVGGAYDSATGIPRMLAKGAANAIGWVAKQFGADEERTDELVQSYKDYLDNEMSGKSIGANTDSWTYKGSKLVGDLAQTATYGGLAKNAVKGALGGYPLVTNATPLGVKATVGALEGATDMGIYSMVSDSELPSGGDLIVGGTLGAAAPMLGAGVNAVTKTLQKGSVKMAEDIIGSMNKMTTTQKNNFIKNFGEKATKWMNDRNIKTGDDLVNYFKTSKKLVDDELAKIGGNFKSQEVTNILEGINSEGLKFEGIVKQAAKTRNPQASRLAELAEKNRNEGLTMSEINEVKRYFESMFGNRYKPATWNQQGNADKHQLMKNLDNELREWQRGTAEQMGFTDLAKLNKETQAARELMNNIKYGDAVGGAITLDDWLFIAQAIERGELGAVVAKKVLESNRFKKRAIDVLNKLGKHQNVDNRVMDALGLSKVTNEKELNKWLSLKRDDIGDVAQDMIIAGAENLND